VKTHWYLWGGYLAGIACGVMWTLAMTR